MFDHPRVSPRARFQASRHDRQLRVICCPSFAADGTLLLPTDNASIIHAVDAAKLPLLADAHAQRTSVASVAGSSVTSVERETTDRAPLVLIKL